MKTNLLVVLCLKVVCMEEMTEKAIQVISPIHPETNEAEIHNLKHGTYLIYCEVQVGT